jgi:hypothetical protein
MAGNTHNSSIKHSQLHTLSRQIEGQSGQLHTIILFMMLYSFLQFCELICVLCWDIHLIQKDGDFIYLCKCKLYSVVLSNKNLPVSYEISPRVTINKMCKIDPGKYE